MLIALADTLRHRTGTWYSAPYTEFHALSLRLLHGGALPRWHCGGAIAATKLLQISAGHIGREASSDYNEILYS